MDNTIKPNTWYTLSDLVEINAFPWCNGDIRRYRSVVEADKRGRDHLKTIMMGRGRGTRYQVKGENLINFLAEIDSGTVRL